MALQSKVNLKSSTDWRCKSPLQWLLLCLRLKLESISIKILDAISQVLTVPLALDYLISKFLVLKSTNADSNSFHRDKCRTNNQTAYAKASLLLSRVTFMYYGFTKRRPVCSFSPYWKRKKITDLDTQN